MTIKRIASHIHPIKLTIVASLITLIILIPKDIFERLTPNCLFTTFFNVSCLGCGTTRALWSILHLRFTEAYQYNKLIVITFPLILYYLIKFIIKKHP